MPLPGAKYLMRIHRETETSTEIPLGMIPFGVSVLHLGLVQGGREGVGLDRQTDTGYVGSSS